MKRGYISFKTKLAAALLQMRRPTQHGGWELIIPHSEATRLTADQIIALFQFDHYPIPHAEGGPDEPWNLDPLLIAGHDEKTATIDVPGIAKRKRVAKAFDRWKETMTIPRDERPPKQSRWGSRPFPTKEKKNDTTRGRRRT